MNGIPKFCKKNMFFFNWFQFETHYNLQYQKRRNKEGIFLYRIYGK